MSTTNMEWFNILSTEIDYCKAIVDDIIDNNRSLEVQKYAQQFAEIESKELGNTEADWIRINYGSIYIYMYNSGIPNHVRYELDPFGYYGTETVSICDCSVEQFKEAVKIELSTNNYDDFDDFEPDEHYVPYKKGN